MLVYVARMYSILYYRICGIIRRLSLVLSLKGLIVSSVIQHLYATSIIHDLVCSDYLSVSE